MRPSKFFSGTIITPTEVIDKGTVLVSEEGNLAYVGGPENAPPFQGQAFDLQGRFLVPGFIDIHVHGGYGVNFNHPRDLAKNIKKYAKWAASKGVTGFLCTLAAPTHADLINLIDAYRPVLEAETTGAELLGLHLEGPYLNKHEKKGAFEPSWLREPSIEEVKAYIDTGGPWLRQMTIDPALPNASKVASLLRAAGVVAALGHTNMDYEMAVQALRTDFSHVTHTFNAQSGFSHRAPGVFGAVLTSDHVTTELIADNIHVHPGAMKVLVRCVGTERIVLISDAIAGTGFGNGSYELAGITVTVQGDRATLENGTLAGSVITLDKCVKNMIRDVGVPFHRAVQMASLNPARAMGFGDRLGSISFGKSANLLVIDKEVNVLLSMVKGKVVYGSL